MSSLKTYKNSKVEKHRKLNCCHQVVHDDQTQARGDECVCVCVRVCVCVCVRACAHLRETERVEESASWLAESWQTFSTVRLLSGWLRLSPPPPASRSGMLYSRADTLPLLSQHFITPGLNSTVCVCVCVSTALQTHTHTQSREEPARQDDARERESGLHTHTHSLTFKKVKESFACRWRREEIEEEMETRWPKVCGHLAPL